MNKQKQSNKQQQHQTNIPKNTVSVSTKQSSSLLPIFIVFCIPVILYLQTVKFGFTNFDDDQIIANNITFLSDFRNVHQAFLTDAFITKTSPFYRPLQTVSYMVDIKLSGAKNTTMFHLSNILLLGVIACSLFLLLKRFLIPSKLALCSTLIFCVHPLFVSSIAWIPARGDLLLLLFTLVSFLCLMEYLKKGKITYLLLHWLSFTIALFCKETAAFLPFLFIAYYFTFPLDKGFEKKHLIVILLYSISGITWFWLRSKAIGDIPIPDNEFGLVALFSNLQVLPESLAKFVMLFDIAPIPFFSPLKTVVGLVIVVAIILLFIKNKERSIQGKAFGLLWFLLLMLPPMLFKNKYIDYFDHRFFLPLIGVLLFSLFTLPTKWYVNGDIKNSWILIAAIVFLSSFTFVKSASYSNPMSFYNAAVTNNPNSAIAVYNRGNVKKEDGDFHGAIDDYNRAIVLYPNYAEVYNNRGIAKLNVGDKQGAITDYNIAILMNNKYADAYYNRGVANMALQNVKEAIDDYNKAIALRPNYAQAYNNKGMLMNTIGNYQEALINLNKAIEINPNHWNTYANRAIAKYNLKDLKGTIADCKKVLQFNPNDQRTINIIAKVQQELNETNH